MLMPLVVSAVLVAAGLLVVARVARFAMRRLGLELASVLLWLGVADDPVDDVTAEARLRWVGKPHRI